MFALVVFVVISMLYAAKWLRFPAAARAEIRHPVRMTFVPTTTISVLILVTAGHRPPHPRLGSAGGSGRWGTCWLTVAVLSAWFSRGDILHSHVTPAWFIPIVGNVITPLAAPALGSVELAWPSFGVGVVFWVALLPLLLQRVLLHDQPLPQRLLPDDRHLHRSAVGGHAVVGVAHGRPDPVGRIFFAAAMMFTVLLFAQVLRLRSIPFALPYWAYSFPLRGAASVAGAIAMAAATDSPLYDAVGAVPARGHHWAHRRGARERSHAACRRPPADLRSRMARAADRRGTP